MSDSRKGSYSSDMEYVRRRQRLAKELERYSSTAAQQVLSGEMDLTMGAYQLNWLKRREQEKKRRELSKYYQRKESGK